MTLNFCSVYKGHFGLNKGHFGKPQRLFWASITVILGDNGHFGCLTVNLVMIFFQINGHFDRPKNTVVQKTKNKGHFVQNNGHYSIK